LEEWGKTGNDTPIGGDCSENTFSAAASYWFSSLITAKIILPVMQAKPLMQSLMSNLRQV
jgi:hypothetical protein